MKDSVCSFITFLGLFLIWTIIGICLLALGGCARKTPVETAFQEVSTSITTVKESLPQECQTQEIMLKIDQIEQKREVAQSVCEAKIKDVQVKYERSLWVLGIIILIFLGKMLIKK